MRGRLTVTVHRAEQLKQSSMFSRLQPYIKLIIGEQSYKTQPGGDPINPTYAQTFTFDLKSEDEGPPLQLQVRDSSLFGASQIASATVPLRDLITFRQLTRVDVIGANSNEPGGFVVISCEWAPADAPAVAPAIAAKEAAPSPSSQPPAVYPQMSSPAAAPPPYNPAFAHPSAAGQSEPPPPYQQVVSPSAAAAAAAATPAAVVASQPVPGTVFRNPPQQPLWNEPHMPPFMRSMLGQPQPQLVAPPAATPAVAAVPFGVDVKDTRHMHAMRHLPVIYNGEYVCNVCRREHRGEVFHCAICNFDMCTGCFLNPAAGRVIAAPPGMVAPHRDVRHPHPLTWQPVYQSRAYQCDGCGGMGVGSAWHCGQCNYDLHAQCLRPVS